MSHTNKLYRNFIILQEDQRGDSNSGDKTLSGYSKIEAKGEKCKVSFYAQNIRKDSGTYSAMLICNKKDSKSIIDLGRVAISDGGKLEVTKEYLSENIAGVEISYDKISGAAIAKIKDGTPIFIMYGFINGEQPGEDWKKNKIIKANDENINLKPKMDAHKTEIDKNKTSKKEVIKKRQDKIVEESVVEDLKPSNLNKKPITNDEKKEDFKDIGERSKFDEYEASIEKKDEEFRVQGSVGEYFESIAEGFKHCKEIYKEIKYCKWYKIPVNDLYEMCNMSNYNKYTIAYYPMLNYYPYIKKYGHFMLGYKCDKEGNLKYIVYGVPGKKDKDEQPYEGKTGYVTWVSDEENSDMGCWLMFYDFKNSTVVVPMQ